MTLTLYISNDDSRKVTKSLQEIATVRTIEPNDSIDVLEIGCSLSYDSAFLNVNYFYCHETEKYYFAKISFNTNRIVSVHGSVDVLMTYRDDILQAPATCIRNEYVGINDIVDSSLPIIQGKYNIVSQIFPSSPLNTDSPVNTIVTTLGG